MRKNEVESNENAGACPSAEVKLREDESRQTNQTQLLLWRRQKIFVSDGTTFKQTQAPLLYKWEERPTSPMSPLSAKMALGWRATSWFYPRARQFSRICWRPIPTHIRCSSWEASSLISWWPWWTLSTAARQALLKMIWKLFLQWQMSSGWRAWKTEKLNQELKRMGAFKLGHWKLQ